MNKKRFLSKMIVSICCGALLCPLPFSSLANAKEEKEIQKITISAAGDCTFGSDRMSPSSVNFYAVRRRVKKKDSYFFKNVKKYFAKDDMTIVNFEGTLTRRTTRADKRFAFRGNPNYVNILKKGSIESVAFANNHCRDFGSGSYTDTIKTFRKNDIKYSSYSRVGTYTVKGVKIGMISVNGLESLSAAKSQISSGMKKLKKKGAKIIIVSMHAGIERQTTPIGTQRTIAHYAIDRGATLVLGHHPHVLQGIEQYRGANIVYSLGNFCFGGNTNPADKDTMIYQQTFSVENGKVKKKNSPARIIPCSLSSKSYINDYQPTPAKGSNKTRILKKVNRYCNRLNTKITKKGKVLKK